MGIAIKIPGTLPAGNYPTLDSFRLLPVSQLLAGWVNYAATVTKDGSNLASAWAGVLGNVAAQGSASLQPVYSDTAIGTKGGMVFDGVDDCLTTSVVAPTSGYLVVGVKNAARGVQQYESFIGAEDGSTARLLLGRSALANGTSQYGIILSDTTMASALGISPVINAVSAVDVVGLLYGAGVFSLRINKVVVKTGTYTGGPATVKSLSIGRQNGGGAFPTNCSIGAVGIYSGTFTDAQLAVIDTAVGKRIGLVI
jgi:hypothetical protein